MLDSPTHTQHMKYTHTATTTTTTSFSKQLFKKTHSYTLADRYVCLKAVKVRGNPFCPFLFLLANQ